MNSGSEFSSEDASEILRRHTKLGATKVVSYLPLSTIENVLKMPLDSYTSLIESNGGISLVFREDSCCISSGAVYAFLPEDLKRILVANKDVLAVAGISSEPAGFIRAIAETWFEDGTSMIPLLKEVFGEH